MLDKDIDLRSKKNDRFGSSALPLAQRHASSQADPDLYARLKIELHASQPRACPRAV
jgi:hypothetical protein